MEKNEFLMLLQKNDAAMSLFFSAEMTPAMKIALAMNYTFSRETFNGPMFEARMKKLQHTAGKQSFTEFFSSVSTKSILNYKIATHLLFHENTEQEIKRLTQNEAYLTAVGFEVSSYQSIAAIFLLDASHAKRAKALHKAMKTQHPFLTGKDDIPYAVLLTRETVDPHVQAQTMRRSYDELVKKDFKRGDALQAMTQLLTLYDENFVPLLIDYAEAIRDQLKRENIKIRRNFYPFIAMLALAQTNEAMLQNVIQLTTELSELAMFTPEPSMALMVAAQFTLQQMVEHQQLQQFNDSLLFLQALTMNDFLQDIKFSIAFNLFDFFTI